MPAQFWVKTNTPCIATGTPPKLAGTRLTLYAAHFAELGQRFRVIA